MSDDAQLLRRYAEERSEAAFTELVNRHLNLVYSAALRQVGGDAHRAHDVAQVVFTALAQKAASLATHPMLTGWLYTATGHAAAKVRRAEARRHAREQEAHAMEELLSSDTPPIDWERLRPVLDEAMRELGDRDREAVLLRFFAQRPFAEIGAALRISEDAARMRVERALDKLQGLLAGRGVTSTAAALGVALANQAVLAAPAGLAASVAGGALASATAVGGGWAGVIQFMTTSKLVASVAGGVVLAVALGTATHERRGLRAAEQSLTETTADVARLDARLREMQQKAKEAERALDVPRADLAIAETAVKAVAPRPMTPNPVEGGKTFLAKHPEARELWDERERANVVAKLAPLRRSLGLSDAQMDQVAMVMVRTMTGSTTLGTADGNIVLERQPTLTRAQAETELQGILGTEGYARFTEQSALAPTFDLTVKLATALYRTEPLSPAQAERVMQIFAAASPMARGGNPNGPAGIDWNAISTEAGAVLSPSQLAALTGVQRAFEYQQAMQKVMRTAQASPAPAPKPSTPPNR